MTGRLAAAAVLAALALPAAALAKEPVRATVWGADGCVTTKDRAAMLPLMEGGPPAAGPEAGAPAYRVRLAIAAEDGGRPPAFTTWISPALSLMRGSDGAWLTLPHTTLAALRRLAGDLRPFPAARPPPPARGGAPPPRGAPRPAPAPPPPRPRERGPAARPHDIHRRAGARAR